MSTSVTLIGLTRRAQQEARADAEGAAA